MPSTAIDPLRTMYGASSRRIANREPERVAVGSNVLDRAGRIDVALHEVAAEPGVRAQRPFEIDQRRRGGAPRARSPARFPARCRHESRQRPQDNGGQAHAIDGHAVARDDLRRDRRRHAQTESG